MRVLISVLALSIFLQGCAKQQDNSRFAKLTFRVDSNRPAPSLMSDPWRLLSLPTSVDGFSCYVANVIGDDIPEKDTDTVPSDTLDYILSGTSHCSYSGVTSDPISPNESTTVSLSVPRGLDRWVEVVGVKDSAGNVCGGNSAADITGDALNDFIFLGGTEFDLFDDRTIEISNQYSSSSPKYVDCGSSSYEDEVLSDDPILYYRLNESSGNNISDQTGNAGTGTLYGTPGSMRASGPLASDSNGATSFDGTSPSFIGHLSSFDLVSGTFSSGMTIELWVKSTDSNSRNLVFLHGQSSNPTISLYANASSQLSVNLYQTAPSVSLSYTFTATATSSVLDGSWHHVVITLTSTSGTLYVDGASVDSVSASGSGSLSSLVYSSANPSCWTFAADTNTGTCNSAMGNTMIASLAEVALYSFELSNSQIRSHYRARNHL